MNKDKNWADDDEDEDYETAVDSNGIKERVKTTINAKGQKVKVVNRIKVQEIKKRTPKGVIERRHLAKFGDAIKETDCVSKEIAIMEHPTDEDAADENDPFMSSLATIASRQEARERDPTQVDFDEEAEKLADAKQKADAVETTIRVSNLSKSVNDHELRDLFSQYGKVVKISLPRIVNSAGLKEPRGFAYITFELRSSAESAMELDGRGYDHLILKLEWAKPPKDGGGGGGLSSGYVSGYGKQLAQDTKEKAVFTSHNNSSY
eukprot:gene20620-26737_t